MNTLYKIIFITVGVAVFHSKAFCQVADKPLDIYLLMGQSNMAGRGKITDSFKTVRNDKVVMLDSNGNWVPAKHPVHFDKPSIAGVGPGLSFGIAMSESSLNTIALVPCAVGGTSIELWSPGAYDKTTRTHPYDDAKKRIALAMKYGQVKGIIWHQGESNSTPEKATVYINRLAELIDRLRKLVGDTSLPFIAGELGYYKNEYRHINEVLRSLPENVKFTAVVSAEGLVHNGDGVHFDGPSADLLGLRFADRMHFIQEKNNPKP